MPSLSTFSNGNRLNRIGPDNFVLDMAGRWVKQGEIAFLYSGDDPTGPIAYSIARAISDKGSAPTAAEASAPTEGSIADVSLSDGSQEFWRHDGTNWSQVELPEGNPFASRIPAAPADGLEIVFFDGNQLDNSQVEYIRWDKGSALATARVSGSDGGDLVNVYEQTSAGQTVSDIVGRLQFDRLVFWSQSGITRMRVTFSDPAQVTSLIISQAEGLYGIDLSSLPNVTALNLVDNVAGIPSPFVFDLAPYPQITQLTMIKGMAAFRPVSPNLQRLELRENFLTELDLSECPSLNYVYVTENKLNAAAIDDMLVSLDASGATGGTLIYFLQSILPGVEMDSERSAAGSAAVTSLLAKGWSRVGTY